MISAGNSYIYATKIEEDDILEDLLNRDLESFDFVSEMNGNLEVSKSINPTFCKNCYYIITVKGSPSVAADITINSGDVPILMKEGTPVRDRL